MAFAFGNERRLTLGHRQGRMPLLEEARSSECQAAAATAVGVLLCCLFGREFGGGGRGSGEVAPTVG